MEKMFWKRIFVFAAVVILATAMSACSLLDGLLGKDREITPDLSPHFILSSERESDPERPLLNDDNESFMPIEPYAAYPTEEKVFWQLDNMTAMIQAGVEPAFDEYTAQAVMDVYDAAIDVLNDIILNDMSDYERVHAISDWLAYMVEYDDELYEQYLQEGALDTYDPAFGVHGVFLNKKAVCDGLSRAFVLMCGIENIRAVKINGDARIDDALIPHAWNRVELDGKWYNVDCTFNSRTVSIVGVVKKYVIHSYFLVPDAIMTEHENVDCAVDFDFTNDVYRLEATEVEPFVALEDYGYYALETFSVGDKTFSHQINTQTELNDLFKQVKNSFPAVGKLELQVSFATTETKWTTAFSGAFARVSDSDFGFEKTLRFINNSGLIFIYK